MKKYAYMQSGQKISEKKQINKKRCFYNTLENLYKVWYTKDGSSTRGWYITRFKMDQLMLVSVR